MELIPELVLATLIALSASLTDGLKAFNEKDYDAAIAKLTEVIKVDSPENMGRDTALLFRAKSYVAKEDDKNAKTDLIDLLKRTIKLPIRKEALKLFTDLEGQPEEFLPKLTPKETWDAYQVAAQKHDFDTCIKLSSGHLAATAMSARRFSEEDFWQQMQRLQVINIKIGVGENFGKAWVTSRHLNNRGNHNNDRVFLWLHELRIDPADFVWKFDTLSYEWANEEDLKESAVLKGKDAVDANRLRNTGNLRQLGLALLMFGGDHDGEFPKTLVELQQGGYLPAGDAYQWIHPLTGNRDLTFIYCPGFRDDDTKAAIRPIAAAPESYAKRRNVLYIDGHVELTDEKEFLTMARKQGWNIKEGSKEFLGSNELRKRVVGLINQLGAHDFKSRRAAKRELKDLGPEILLLLEEELTHKDPEVRESVKEIIEAM